MLRLVEDLAHRRVLDDAAAIHDEDAVAEPGHHAERMGDQHDRGVAAALELAHEIEDLRLDGDVERGGGLIGDQQIRLAEQRHRDHHALAHAAGEFVRIRVEPARRLGDAHALEERDRGGPRLGLAHAAVGDQNLGHLPADPEIGIERGHGVLEDHGDAAAADAVERVRSHAEELDPSKARAAGCAAVRRQEP
jgi:hypothetical protein